MGLAHVLAFSPGTDGQEDRAMPVYMVGTVLGIVLHHKDHGIFPTWTLGYEFDSHAQSRIVVLNKAPERPFWTVGFNVFSTAAVVVRVVEIHERR